MDTGFHDPIKVKEKKNGDYPFEFKAPSYDERSSCFMKAGDNYGVGHRQPVGKESAKNSDVIPKGRVNTLKLYEER